MHQVQVEAALTILADEHNLFLWREQGEGWAFAHGSNHRPSKLYPTIAEAIAAELEAIEARAADLEHRADDTARKSLAAPSGDGAPRSMLPVNFAGAPLMSSQCCDACGVALVWVATEWLHAAPTRCNNFETLGPDSRASCSCLCTQCPRAQHDRCHPGDCA